MFEVMTLASGSAGNALLVRGRSTIFLVDAGLSAKKLTERLAACGLGLGDLSGILLTHEHHDHSSALKVLLARQTLPVFCNSHTAHALTASGLRHQDWRLFQSDAEFNLGEFTIRPFKVPHDAVEPVGFRISTGGVSFGVLTDLGHVPQLVFEALRGIHAILIETNYDDELLQKDSRRPWSVKERIRAKHGHLSNAEAGRVLAALDAPELRYVLLAHLSRDCNAPHLAEESVRRTLTAAGRISDAVVIHCAGQDSPSPVFALI